eukprot:gene7023-8164_t
MSSHVAKNMVKLSAEADDSSDSGGAGAVNNRGYNDDHTEESDTASSDDVDLDTFDSDYFEKDDLDDNIRRRKLRIIMYKKLYKKLDFALEHVNIVMSVFSVALFIALTYMDPDSKASKNISYLVFAISLFFVFDFTRQIIFTQQKLKFLKKMSTIIDIITLLPIFVTLLPNEYVDIVPLSFLRVLRILKATRLFKLHGANGIVQKTVQLILSIIILIILFASMITSVEKIKFHNALYFAVVTLSTVGYGDITPLSTVGRMLTIAMIITALLYLPIQTSELLSILSATKPSQEDDEDNILRVMAVRAFAPHVPIYAQVMSPSLRGHMLTAGANHVISVQELKMNLLAQSCLCPGFSTMIINLLRSDLNRYNETDEYGSGNSYEIFTQTFSASFVGVSFKETAKIVYDKFGMILFGVESTFHGKKRIKINPQKGYVIMAGDSGIMLAKSKQASKRIKFCSSVYVDAERKEAPARLESKVSWTYDPLKKKYL